MPVDTSRRFTLPIPREALPAGRPRLAWDYFHATERPTHKGLDLAAVHGTPISSSHPADSKLHRAGLLNTIAGYGVELLEPWVSGIYASRYLHMIEASIPAWPVGTIVVPGAPIGRVNTSGQGTNYSHVHFEIRWGTSMPYPGQDLSGWGTPIDPLLFGILDASSTAKLTRVTVDRPILRVGSTGAAVLDLQYLLASRGYTTGPFDGIFGSKTETAVRAFQTAKGLVSDGIVGFSTWTVLLDF